MLELFKFPCFLGCPQLAAVSHTDQVSWLRGSMHAEVILREEERVQEYPLRITWLPVESNSRLDEDTNLTGCVFGRQPKASSTQACISSKVKLWCFRSFWQQATSSTSASFLLYTRHMITSFKCY